MKTFFLAFLGAVVGVALLFVALDFFVLHNFFGAPATPISSTTPTSTVNPSSTTPSTTTPSTTTIDQTINDVNQAINEALATGEPQDVSVTISEAEANAQASEMLASVEQPADSSLHINSVGLDFKTGNRVVINVNATADVGISFTTNVAVDTSVSIADGKPAVDIEDVSFTGSALLPSSIKQQIYDYLEGQIDDMLTQLTSVDLGSGNELTVEYTGVTVSENSVLLSLELIP